MAKTSLERQRRAAEQLVATLTDGHPDVAARAVHMVVQHAAGPYYWPYAVPFAGVDTLILDQFSSEYRTEVGPARLRELIEEEFLPSSEDLAKLITQDPRWFAVLTDAVRALLRGKLLELEADRDLTHEEITRRVDARLRDRPAEAPPGLRLAGDSRAGTWTVG